MCGAQRGVFHPRGFHSFALHCVLRYNMIFQLKIINIEKFSTHVCYFFLCEIFHM